MIMSARSKANPAGRRKSGHQDFLSKPAKRRRRPTSRQHRQEQARPLAVRADSHKTTRSRPQLSWLRVMAGVLLIGMIALMAFLFADDSFYVKTAAIRGLRLTTAEEIYRQADIDQYSIFWIVDREVAQRIETLPYVKRATIRTALPNQVRIEIEEREPVVVWNIGDQTYWVDNEGITMPVASKALDLPVLWDLDGSTTTANDQLDRQLIASVRQVKEQAPEVTDFGYDRINGLQFRFPGGTFVYLGHPEGMAKRVASLLVLHQSLASQGQTPAEINWRSENGYYLRLAQ
jgi:cell division septal protein FtsQ